MKKDKRYREIVETKAEFRRLFLKQKSVFSEEFTPCDQPLLTVLIYPTGGVCVEALKTYAFYRKTIYFYTHDLRLICRENFECGLVPFSEHERVFYNKAGDLIWRAYRWCRDFDLYLPTGTYNFRKCSTSLRSLYSRYKYKIINSDPKPFKLKHILTKEIIRGVQEKYQALRKI